MAKNRKNPPTSHKQKQERLAEAKERRRQAEAQLEAKQQQQVHAARFDNALAKHRKSRKIEDIVEVIWEGKEPGCYSTKIEHLSAIRRALSGHPDYLIKSKELVLTLEEKRCKLLDRPGAEASNYRNGLIDLSRHYLKWVQPLATWKPATKNAHRQFASLLRHLLAKYEIPLFMDEAWTTGAPARIGWWIHVAQGGNIRTAEGMPTPLTKMMAHHMMQAPSTYSINAAIRWGQIHALGGNERIVRGLLDSHLCRGIEGAREEFWISFFRWLIANPMLDPAQYTPIIDYILNQKYLIPMGANAPPQPGFSIKDRQPNVLLRQVEEWHEKLRREGRIQEKNATSWSHHPRIQDYQLITGPEHNQTTYQIVQLLSSKELFAEGARLHHCVGSYSHSCASSRISIWSTRRLTHPQSSSFDLFGTIEVDNAQNKIIQFRAKNNARPPEQAYKMLNQWAGQNSLEISGWL